MTTVIEDYYGNELRVELGFRCPQQQRGVGFVVERGLVSIKGDFFQVYGFQQELQRRLVQDYTATAH